LSKFCADTRALAQFCLLVELPVSDAGPGNSWPGSNLTISPGGALVLRWSSRLRGARASHPCRRKPLALQPEPPRMLSGTAPLYCQGSQGDLKKGLEDLALRDDNLKWERFEVAPVVQAQCSSHSGRLSTPLHQQI
jgi:hypothetical protein